MNDNIELEMLKLVKSDMSNLSEVIIGGFSDKFLLDKDAKIAWNALSTIEELGLYMTDSIFLNELNKITHDEGKSKSIVNNINSIDNSNVKNIGYYLQEIKKRYKTHTVKNALSEALKSANPEGIDKIAANLMSSIEEIDQDLEEQLAQDSMDSIYDAIIAKFENIKENGYSDNTLTHYNILDKLIGGFEKGSLNIIAARPAMGKTAFALNVANNISFNKKVLFYSFEMDQQMLMQRVMSINTSINGYKFKKPEYLNDFDNAMLREYRKVLQKQNLTIIDSSSMSDIKHIVAKTKQLHRAGKVDFIIIDYLQLMEVGGSKGADNRQNEVSMISRKLKLLAKDLGVPIIALAQLSRSVEKRDSKIPLLSDLRESGSIEQDADTVSFLYRDAYYNNKGGIEGECQKVDIIVAKNRNGSTGVVKLAFMPSIGKFEDIAQEIGSVNND